MNSSRRDFLKKGVLALASSGLLSNSRIVPNKTENTLGIQLWCVREEMQIDPLGTLVQLAKLGYEYVEHANYVDRKFYGYSAKALKSILTELGVNMLSGHVVLGKQHWDKTKSDFTDEWKYLLEDAAVVGQRFVITSWMEESFRKTYDDLMQTMELFNNCGELCNKLGVRFGYHSHDFEFSQKFMDVRVYDLILQNTDPRLVAQELDIGNLYNGGAKAIDIVKKFPGRFQLMHVKDVIPSSADNGKFESTILGNGIVNVKEVIDLGRESGVTTHFIIEQESYQGMTPMACMKENYNIMKRWGY